MKPKTLLLLTTLTGVACSGRDALVDLSDVTQVTVLGVAGGEAVSPSGALRVVFPAHALSAETSVTITESVGSGVPGQIGPTYHLGPRGTRLDAPVELRVRVPSGGSDPVGLARVGTGRALPVTTTGYDPRSETLEVSITELESYAVVAAGSAVSCLRSDAGMPLQSTSIFPCWIDEQEPNDTAATAQALNVPLDDAVDVLAFIDATDDFFSFDIPAGATGAILASVGGAEAPFGCPPGLAVEAELIGPGGAVIGTGTHEAGRCPTFNYRVDPTSRELPPGHYVMRLHRGAGGQSMPYRFSLFLLGPGLGHVEVGTDGGI